MCVKEFKQCQQQCLDYAQQSSSSSSSQQFLDSLSQCYLELYFWEGPKIWDSCRDLARHEFVRLINRWPKECQKTLKKYVLGNFFNSGGGGGGLALGFAVLVVEVGREQAA